MYSHFEISNYTYNMKFLLVFVALFAVALAAPNSEGDAYIVKYDSDNIGVEGYNFAYVKRKLNVGTIE